MRGLLVGLSNGLLGSWVRLSHVRIGFEVDHFEDHFTAKLFLPKMLPPKMSPKKFTPFILPH